MEKDNIKLSRKTIKIIVALFVSALILSASFDLWGNKFLPSTNSSEVKETFSLKLRNKRIDSIKPSIKKNADSIYSDEDINNAVLKIKENFSERDVYVSLSRIVFDEEKCNKIRDNESRKDEFEDKNIIVFLCDYFVFKDFAAYSKGIYTDYNMVLARENENAPWEIIDQGYA